MRKGLRILGVLVLFTGLILVSISYSAVSLDPKWVTVKEERASLDKLSVEGNLTKNDSFMVAFTLMKPPTMIPDFAAVLINVTDPQGYVFIENYEIPISLDYSTGTPALGRDFPGGVTNITGLYKVNAWAIAGLSLRTLSLQKLEIEFQHPYMNLLPVGAVVFVGGVVISLLCVKSSGSKKLHLKAHARKKFG